MNWIVSESPDRKRAEKQGRIVTLVYGAGNQRPYVDRVQMWFDVSGWQIHPLGRSHFDTTKEADTFFSNYLKDN